MTNNVICFARSITHTKPAVALLEDHDGLWLPSGEMYGDGVEVENAFKTLFELTGILADKTLIRQAGLVYVGFKVYRIMDCPFRGEFHVEQGEEPAVPSVMSLNRLLKDKRTSPLTKMMVSLCHGGQHGWTIHRIDSKTLHLRMP
jgi:hypothetical protein